MVRNLILFIVLHVLPPGNIIAVNSFSGIDCFPIVFVKIFSKNSPILFWKVLSVRRTTLLTSKSTIRELFPSELEYVSSVISKSSKSRQSKRMSNIYFRGRTCKCMLYIYVLTYLLYSKIKAQIIYLKILQLQF